MEANFFKFQVFLFADYDEVVASSETINFFVGKFLPHNFIPKQVQEVSLNLKGNKPEDFKQELINRIGLNSLDRKWEIIFHKDSLNITYSFDLSKTDEVFSLEDFKKFTLQYLELIEEKFSKKFYRLGLVIDKLVPIADANMKTSFLKYNKSSDFLGEELSPIEWTNKVVVRKKVNELRDEIVNVSNVNSFIQAKLNSNNKEIDFKGVHNVIDINTLSFIVDKRFNKDDVETFIDKSINLAEKVLAYNNL